MWTTATSRRTQGEPTSESEHRVAALRTRRNARPRTETAMLKRQRVQTATRVRRLPSSRAPAGGMAEEWPRARSAAAGAPWPPVTRTDAHGGKLIQAPATAALT